MSKHDHRLIQASLEGDVSKIDKLLSKNANVNFTNDHYKQFPLLVASQNGHKEAVQHLVDGGADVNLESRQKVTALSIASECGHHDVVEILIEKGAGIDHQVSDGRTPLMLASQNGHVETVRVLISKNADVNQWALKTCVTALSLAIENKHTKIVKQLLPHVAHIDRRDGSGYTHLICAAINGLADVVDSLIEKGVPVDQRGPNGTTALIMASRVGHRETGDILLKHGADVDLQDMDGQSALITACINNYIEFAKLLVSKNAEVDLRLHSTLQTALFIASSKGNKEIVELLLQHKANVNVIDTQGKTALSVACSGGYYEIVNVLIQNGANVKATRRGEESALSKAISCHNVDIVRLLLENKAEVSYIDLVYVCKSGLLDILELLIPCVAGVNGQYSNDQSPLWWATRNDHKEIVSLLLENGANPDNGSGRNNYIISTDLYRQVERKTYAAPLVIATINENIEIVELLLRKGASIDKQCTFVSSRDPYSAHQDKVSPIMLAILASNSKLVEVFVNHNANVMHHITSLGGMIESFTPIHVAVAVGNKKILQILKEAKDLPSHPPPRIDPKYTHYITATASVILQSVRYVRDLVKQTCFLKPSFQPHVVKDTVIPDHCVPAFHNEKLSELFPKRDESEKDSDDETSQTQSCEPPTINNVFEILIPLASEWKNIGLLLHIKNDKLQTIEKDQSRSIDCVREMVTEWFKNVDSPPSWEVLEKSVHYFDQTIAQDIHTKYSS